MDAVSNNEYAIITNINNEYAIITNINKRRRFSDGWVWRCVDAAKDVGAEIRRCEEAARILEQL